MSKMVSFAEKPYSPGIAVSSGEKKKPKPSKSRTQQGKNALIPENWVKPFVFDICKLAKGKGVKLNPEDYPNGFGLADVNSLEKLL